MVTSFLLYKQERQHYTIFLNLYIFKFELDFRVSSPKLQKTTYSISHLA